MKFEEKRVSRADGFSTTYNFTMGKEEVRLLMDLCRDARNKMFRTLETQSTRSRLKNCLNTLKEALDL